MQCRVCPAAIPSQSSKTSPASTQTAVIEDRDLHPPRRSHRRQRPASTPTHSSKTETRIHPDAVIEDRDPHPPRRSHRRQRPAPNTTQSSKTETCTHHDAAIEDRDPHPPRRSHRRQRPAPTPTQSSKTETRTHHDAVIEDDAIVVNPTKSGTRLVRVQPAHTPKKSSQRTLSYSPTTYSAAGPKHPHGKTKRACSRPSWAPLSPRRYHNNHPPKPTGQPPTGTNSSPPTESTP